MNKGEMAERETKGGKEGIKVENILRLSDYD